MITLHFNNKKLEVQESESSYRYRAIMQKPQLVLKFSLPTYEEIPVGTWCEFMGEVYTLPSSQNIKKHGKRNIEYTLVMVDDSDKLSCFKFRNTIDKRLKWSMCAKPIEFLNAIVASLNERDKGWSVGKCIEASEKTLEFNHVYIDEALQDVAELFNTEWEIKDKVISFGKVEYFKDSPLALSYGKGNGFMPGLGRTTLSDEKPIKRLYVQGGEKNIDRSKYGSPELLLPISQELVYEGRTYRTDDKGYSIERVDKITDAVKEDSLDCSEIYPSRIGKVSSVTVVDEAKHFYDFTDTTIPADLDFNQYLIEGETPVIRFQTGMLAGEKDFEFKYIHKDKDGSLARRFEIVPQEIDGQTMPNKNYIPVPGNSYAIFGIMLPQQYICDNETKTGASWDMFREGAKYLYEHEDQKFTFNGEIQALWSKKNWLNVGGKLVVGGYVLFTDEQFAKEGVLIRITGIKEYLTSPYSPNVEISNTVAGKTVSSSLRDIENTEVVIDSTKKELVQFTKRRFRDSKETLQMIEGALLNFSGSINPVTVHTMAMLVGDESLQFRFVESKTNLTQVTHNITYDNEKKQLHCPRGFLQHMTLGINNISSKHSDKEYKVWDMSEFLSPRLADPKKKYYLYAKVSHDANVRGNFVLSEKPIALNDLTGFYHLLTGVLNSEYEGGRSYVSLYGFTEVLPGRITTDRVVSGDGTSFFDLVANALRLGDKLSYNVKGDNLLRLKGTLVQSNSGQESVIGCYRGVYNSRDTYFNGDEVTYTDAIGLTSTYRYIFATPTTGVAPDNGSYWQVIAQGSHGKDGVNGAAGVNGKDGKSIIWKGEFSSHPANPEEGWAYRNSTDKKSYVFHSGQWYQMTVDGIDGKNGITTYTWIRYADDEFGSGISNDPTGKEYIGIAHNKTTAIESNIPNDYQWFLVKGTEGVPGKPGADGKTYYTWIAYSDNADGAGMYQIPTSTTKYIGIATNKLTNVESTNPKDYAWSKFKGDQGVPGKDGMSIVWKGDLANPPANPVKNWVYRDTDNGRVYIFNGTAWELMVVDGSNGIDGADGKDGLSVYITYHDSVSMPSTPTGDGTTGGWHTNATSASVWMSQKVSNSAVSGSWGAPIKIKAFDGQPGKDGHSPAMVYRGNYSDLEGYYGTPYRVDVVKAGSMYYVARTDAGEPFTKVPPPNSAYWNTFGAQFDSIATGLLLAEGANIANFLFVNQRMESQGKTGNVPNIILDGLRNYASFAGGKVHFDRDIAKIAWLEIVGNDIIGYDSDGSERIKITNSKLPAMSSLAEYQYLANCTYKVQPDSTFDEERLEVERRGYRTEIRDDWSGNRIEEDNDIWADITFEITEDDTVTDFDFQCGVSAQVSNYDSYVIIKKYGTSTIVAQSDRESLSTKLNKGKYTATLRAIFNSDRDWSGTMSLNFRPPQIRKWARQTIIGNDGLLVTGGGNYLKQTPNSFEVSVGNNGLKVTSSGIQKQVNGKWSNL